MENLSKYAIYIFILILFSCNGTVDEEQVVVVSPPFLKKKTIQFASIYPGGEKVFYSIEGDIYCSEFSEGNWSEGIKVEGVINTEFIESNPAVSPDGGYMYFTSNREGGVGGSDIYLAKLDDENNWGTVVNLGPVVNTRLDEDMPYMSKDGERFYYISKGHQSIGGYDIFMSEIKENGFAIAESMADINTESDDMLYVYFLSEGYALKTDSVANIDNLVLVNSSFSGLVLANDFPDEHVKNNKGLVLEYLKGDVDYLNLLTVFGEVKSEGVHYELQIGASKGDLVLGNKLKNVGELVVRDVSDGLKRYSLGVYETLNEVEYVKQILSKEGYVDAFMVCYINRKKVTLREVLKNYVTDEVGN